MLRCGSGMLLAKEFLFLRLGQLGTQCSRSRHAEQHQGGKDLSTGHVEKGYQPRDQDQVAVGPLRFFP